MNPPIKRGTPRPALGPIGPQTSNPPPLINRSPHLVWVPFCSAPRLVRVLATRRVPRAASVAGTRRTRGPGPLGPPAARPLDCFWRRSSRISFTSVAPSLDKVGMSRLARSHPGRTGASVPEAERRRGGLRGLRNSVPPPFRKIRGCGEMFHLFIGLIFCSASYLVCCMVSQGSRLLQGVPLSGLL